MTFLKGIFWLLLAGSFVAGAVHARKHFIDYPVYELAGQKVLSGKSSELYDTTRSTPGGYYYSYFFAIAFAPFAFVGGGFGKLWFLALLCAAFWKILRFSVDTAFRLNGGTPPEDNWFAAAILTFLLGLYALNDAFMNANIGILLLALCILAFEWSEKNEWIAGQFMALAIVFKFYPVFVLCFFVWEKRWKLVLSSILGFSVLFFALPFLTLGLDGGAKLLGDQWYVVSHFGSHWRYDSLVFQSLHATVMRYASLLNLDPDTAFRWSVVISCSAVFFFFLPSFLRPRKSLDEDFVQKRFLLILALVPVLVPVSWYNMGLFYVPIIAYLVVRVLRERVKEAAAGLGIYTLLYCLTTPDIVGKPRNDWLEFHAVPFFGAAALIFAYVLVSRPTRELNLRDT